MSTEELGPYVLLHKLAEDALGETYRAGLKSRGDVERVVLLFRFQTDQEAAHWIADTASVGRRALKGLRSPHLAEIVDSGEIDGSAYLAYDYVTGVSLSRLTAEVQRSGLPMPLEQALLIIDRSARALVAAWEHESRMLHGFLVPPLVMVSSEGEVRLLGLEVASRLRRLLADDAVRHHLGAYLAPELVPDGQPATTDDVYSLGAMLYELATGAVPPATAEDLEPAVASARLADGSDLPEEIRQLLATSMAVPMKRSSLKEWAENLNEIVVSGRYDATSFNLALQLHRLFGDELEDDAVATATGTVGSPAETDDQGPEVDAMAALALELEAADEFDSADDVEAAEDLQVVEASEVDAAFAPTEEIEGVPAELLAASTGTASRRQISIAASVGAVALVALSAWFFLGRSASSSAPDMADAGVAMQQLPAQMPASVGLESEQGSGTEAETATTNASPDGGTTTSPTIQLATQKSTAKNPTIEKSTPTEKPTTTMKPVEQASTSSRGSASTQPSGTGSSPTQPAAQQPEEIAAAVSPPEPVESNTTTTLTKPEEQVAELDPPDTNAVVESAEATEVAEVTPPVITLPGQIDSNASGAGSIQTASLPAQQSASVAGPPTTQTAADMTARTTPNQAVTPPPTPPTPQTDLPQSPPATEPAAIESQPEPEAPVAVQAGDLVSPGPGVVPPKLVRSVQPAYPIMARRLNKSADVALRVLVDETGEVAEIERLGEVAGFGLDEAAIKAASRMSWEPATKDGVPVKIWWTVRVAFTP